MHALVVMINKPEMAVHTWQGVLYTSYLVSNVAGYGKRDHFAQK